MRLICAGRTVLIIAHRLSAVRDAHRIIVMERGQIAEIGSHSELLQNPQGTYTHLYQLQSGLQQEPQKPHSHHGKTEPHSTAHPVMPTPFGGAV
jgi:subfamily B ATP-binding cassette protein HlyB/CyaB